MPTPRRVLLAAAFSVMAAAASAAAVPPPSSAAAPVTSASLAPVPVAVRFQGQAPLKGFEASSLLSVPVAPGVGPAFWCVSDEGYIQDCLGLVVCPPSAGLPPGQAAIRMATVAVTTGTAMEPTDDAESMARHDGHVYVFGSSFGKKTGPLERKRGYVGRFADTAPDLEAPHVELDLPPARQTLHRAINDALRATPDLKLIPAGPGETGVYIAIATATATKGSAVLPGDRAINMEGAEFLPDGTLLAGLRFPTTAAGDPLIAVVAGVPAMFDAKPVAPRVTGFLTLRGAGAPGAPAGLRELRRRPPAAATTTTTTTATAAGTLGASGTATLWAVTGNIERTGDKGVVPALLSDHPGADAVISAVWTLAIAPADLAPAPAAAGRPFARALTPAPVPAAVALPPNAPGATPRRDVEGVEAGPDGAPWFCLDEASRKMVEILVPATR